MYSIDLGKPKKPIFDTIAIMLTLEPIFILINIEHKPKCLAAFDHSKKNVMITILKAIDFFRMNKQPFEIEKNSEKSKFRNAAAAE